MFSHKKHLLDIYSNQQKYELLFNVLIKHLMLAIFGTITGITAIYNDRHSG